MNPRTKEAAPRREGGTLADQQAAGRADRVQRTTGPARVEQVGDEIRVTFPFNRQLVDALKTLPGAHYVPAHWSVPAEHLVEAVELVTDVFGPPTVDTPRGGRR